VEAEVRSGGTKMKAKFRLLAVLAITATVGVVSLV
jgi:hypothetical protein